MISSLTSSPRIILVVAIGACLGSQIVACGDNMTVPPPSDVSEAGSSAPALQSMERSELLGKAADPSVATNPVTPDQASANQDANQVLNQGSNAATPTVLAPAMIIRNGEVSIEVDSLEIAIGAVQKLATSLGGYVGNTSLTAGAYSVRSAMLELKIPSARYDNALNGLSPIGKVESQSSTAQDVGEDFVDLTARQANSRRLEERLITLLATRTGKLEDVLAVERELARVREEVERYEGRLRYLRAHVATSTLTVTVHEKRPVVSEYAGRNPIVEAFKSAWRNFVSFCTLLVAALGWLIPLALIGWLLFAVAKRVASRRTRAGK